MYTYRELYRAYERADSAWSKEGQRLFGRNWGDVRYTKEAHGRPGTRLAELHAAYVAARDAYRAENERRHVSAGLGEDTDFCPSDNT